MLNQTSEFKLRIVRTILAILWCVLILSLFWDPLTPALNDPNPETTLNTPFKLNMNKLVFVQGVPIPEEKYPMGARIFWTMLVPLVPFILLFFGHEFWRRICPLSFFQQLPQYLGFQRHNKSFNRKTGNIERNQRLVKAESWLARNYWSVQFFFLYFGISSRLLFSNSDRWGLGFFLIGIIVMALITGFVFGGKTWCNYLCPISPVQKIYTEPRGLLESKAHTDNSLLTQSMCRTFTKYGEDQSTCVACISPCPDIDLERSYWESMEDKGKRFFYYGYFGLVLGFYTYYMLFAGNWNYYFSGAWTHEPDQIGTLFYPGFYLFDQKIDIIPKIVAAPLTLALFILASNFIFRMWERAYHVIRKWRKKPYAQEKGRHHTYTVAAFSTFNCFYLFGGRPNINLFPDEVITAIDMTIVFASTIWFFRTLKCDETTYRREGLVGSLRRQLTKLKINFSKILEGRSIDELNTDEVYILAKTVPGFTASQKKQVYRDVLRETLTSGKADVKSSLESLRELRNQLELTVDDHHQVSDQIQIEISQIMEWQQSSSKEGFIRLRNYQNALESILRKAMDSGIPIKEALQRKEIKQEIDQIKTIFNIAEDDHEEFISSMLGEDNLLLSQAAGLLDQLMLTMGKSFSLQLKVGNLDDSIMRFLKSVIDQKKQTILLQLLNILTSIEDSPEAMRIAQSIYNVAVDDIKSIFQSENRLIEEKQTHWEEHIHPALLDALLKERAGIPKPDSEDKIHVLNIEKVKENIPSPITVLEEIAKDQKPVQMAIAMFAITKLHKQKGRSIANAAIMKKGALHWFVKEVAENLLGINLEIKEKVRYLVELEINSPSQPSVKKIFKSAEISVGRSSTNDVVIRNNSVSENHFNIIQNEKGLSITDMGSALGTLVGKKVARSETIALKNEQEVQVGQDSGVTVKVSWWGVEEAEKEVVKEQGYRHVDSDTLTKLLWLFESQFFSNLSPDVLVELARSAETRVYADGTAIMKKGDKSDKVFVLCSGEATVKLDKTKNLRAVEVIPVGHSIGELGIFTRQPRSSTVYSTKPKTMLIAIDGDDIMSVVSHNSKVATSFLQLLSTRQQQIIQRLALTV